MLPLWTPSVCSELDHMQLHSAEAVLTATDTLLAARQQCTSVSENEILCGDAYSGQTLTDLLSFQYWSINYPPWL